MAEIVNLNKARKLKQRAKKRAQADENAIKFGQTKAERELARSRTEKSARDLDGKKRED